MLSGQCLSSFNEHLGEVSGLDISRNGSLVLSASKDNSNRLWENRMGTVLHRLKGHQNTSKNFIRCCFGPSSTLKGDSSSESIFIPFLHMPPPCSLISNELFYQPHNNLINSISCLQWERRRFGCWLGFNDWRAFDAPLA